MEIETDILRLFAYMIIQIKNYGSAWLIIKQIIQEFYAGSCYKFLMPVTNAAL